MKISFVETMRGTLRDLQGTDQPISFDVGASALGGGRFELKGLVSAPPWAPQAPAEGTLVMSLFEPAMTYQLRFTATDGALLTLDAQKHPTPLAPVRSMTEMETTLRDAGGQLLANGRMFFDLADLVPFLRSWLPLSRSQRRNLDVRRRAVARQLL